MHDTLLISIVGILINISKIMKKSPIYNSIKLISSYY